jgi:hypothetical protein
MAGMRGRGGSRWRGMVLIVGQLVLAISVVALLAVWRSRDLATAANLGQVLGVVLAVPALSAGLVAWSRSKSRPAVAPSNSVPLAAEALARLVAEQWEAEAAILSLDDPDPMPIRWRLATDTGVMDHPRSVSAHTKTVWNGRGDRIDNLAAQFRALRRRRLVILGGPGSGKTTLAVQLLRALLATRVDGEPVPVLVSVGGWDTQACPDLWEWMAGQLATGYRALSASQYGPSAVRDLVTGPNRRVLPVLDGLDEIPESARAAVLQALNKSLGTGQLILTCRTSEYARAVHDAANVLTGAALIEPIPLTPKAAAGFLTTCLPPTPSPSWQRLLDDLRTGAATPLAEVCSTPLGLWLLRTTHSDRAADPSSLTDPIRFPSAAAVQADLFARLIPTLIDARIPTGNPANPFRPRKRHDPADATRWLGYLAHNLSHPQSSSDNQRNRDFAWWRLAAATLAATRLRRARMSGVLLIGAVIPLLVVGLALMSVTTYGVTFGIVAGLATGLGCGLTAGMIAGLASRLMLGKWTEAEPGYADLHVAGRTAQLFKKLGSGLRFGLAAGSVAGAAAGLVVGINVELTSGNAVALAAGPIGGVVMGMVIGPVVGPVVGLISWAEAPTPMGRAATPFTTWRADKTLSILRFLAFGLGFGLLFGLLFGLAFGSGLGLTAGIVFGLASGLGAGLVSGLLGGLTVGKHNAWPMYVIATIWLARRELLPRRLMPFLDDAHRLGLLRAIGPVYQFRHAQFQDHLAAQYESTT